MAIEFRGPAKRLDDIDLPGIGSLIGVGEDEIHAVLTVESSGSGFDDRNRPKMLFEPHVFYRNLPAGPKRDRAVREGLAYPKWKPGAYPKDSYPRLLAAINIDETAALKAASWGLGQVLGENHRMAGCATVQEMVTACVADEENHLRQMVNFIKAKHLDDELRRHDWAGFAYGYNGEQYAVHNYDGRLAAAYAKWQRIKDTPFDVNEWRARAAREEAQHAAAQKPPPVNIPAPAEKPDTPKNNTGGMIGGAVVIGSGAVVANEVKKSGAHTGEVLAVLAMFVVIAVAVFFTIRHWRTHS